MRVDELVDKVKQWDNYLTVTTRCIMDTFGVNYYTAHRVMKAL